MHGATTVASSAATKFLARVQSSVAVPMYNGATMLATHKEVRHSYEHSMHRIPA